MLCVIIEEDIIRYVNKKFMVTSDDEKKKDFRLGLGNIDIIIIIIIYSYLL